MSSIRTALVTGGAGFIGSHLVDRLLDEGWSVIVIDKMKCGYLSNLQQHEGSSMLKIYNYDINDTKKLNRIIDGCSTIFHIAAHADIRESLSNRRADLENNLMGTVNLLEAMVNNNVSDFVFASTSAIYGEALIRPTPEDYTPIQTSLYGASKAACEAYAQAYTQLAPINTWSFRFANVVGERCRRGVIWDFVHKLEMNPRELEILGDGKQSKEYLYVKDCVEGIMLGYEKTSEDVNIFNLGLEEQTTVDKVADIVIEEMKLKNVNRRYTGGSRGWIGDNPIINLSIEKMKKIGWQPKVSSEEAIKRTVRWIIGNEIDKEIL